MSILDPIKELLVDMEDESKCSWKNNGYHSHDTVMDNYNVIRDLMNQIDRGRFIEGTDEWKEWNDG